MKTVLASEILSVFLLLANGENEVSLSSAKMSTRYLKATSVNQKERVKRVNYVKQPKSTPAFFRARDKAQRRSGSEIWQWDYLCQLQPKIGNCHETLQRYYYDAQKERCVTFTYSGCGGNENNFASLVECGRHCAGAGFSDLKDITISECALQPNAGLCVATLVKYYYDINDATCKIFIFGGCGGNENRFNTKQKCIKHCGSN